MFTATQPVVVDDTGVRTGGTLRVLGPGDPVSLDPATLDDPASARLTRLYARQLFTYRPDPELRNWQAIAPVPDLASQIPSIYNAGLGTSGTTYVVHLRPGPAWDTAQPRAVTAHDVVRGMKRLANPVRPAAVLPYFLSTVRGMAEFHAAFRAAAGDRPTAAGLADFQNSTEIAGIFALDDESLVFELVRPALDFIPMLALPAVSPAPAEYDAYLPDSAELRQNLRSNGPYRVSAYRPGERLVLEPNPVWRQDTDPVRRRYPDRIEVGLGAASDPASLADAVRSGRADLLWNAAVPETYDGEPADPGTGLGYRLDPCLLLNVRDPLVRNAVAHAVDRAAVARAVAALRTGTAIRVAGGIIPPGNDGHTGRDPEPGPGHHGDPARARELLAEAGHPDGITLRLAHPDTPEGAAVAQALVEALRPAGITAEPVARPVRDHREPAAGPDGDWDLATVSLSPAWQHGNGRVFLQRLFAGGPDPELDRLITAALDTIDPRLAVRAWQEVERRALAETAAVPLLFQTPSVPRLRGADVRGAVAMPSLAYDDDLATVWLDRP